MRGYFSELHFIAKRALEHCKTARYRENVQRRSGGIAAKLTARGGFGKNFAQQLGDRA